VNLVSLPSALDWTGTACRVPTKHYELAHDLEFGVCFEERGEVNFFSKGISKAMEFA
jgi:hypothetical protein